MHYLAEMKFVVDFVVSNFHSKVTELLVRCLTDSKTIKSKLAEKLVNICVCHGEKERALYFLLA